MATLQFLGGTGTVTGSKFLVRHRPGTIHLVHGKPAASEALAGTLRERYGHVVHVPCYLEKVTP